MWSQKRRCPRLGDKTEQEPTDWQSLNDDSQIYDVQNERSIEMKQTYTSYNQLPLTLQADDVAAVLGISRGGAYTLMH